MRVSNNDDALTATSDWMWMTLMRLGRKAEAAKLLERITPKMEILENGSYHRRLLMYKGLEKPETLLDPAKADGLTIATQGYGVGNWYFVTGNRARAREIFEQVVMRTQLVGVRLHRGRSRPAADEVVERPAEKSIMNLDAHPTLTGHSYGTATLDITRTFN